MELKNEMDAILKKRKGLNINDDFGIEKCWNEMTVLLTQNEDETIDYLNECNEDNLYYISEIFEDISEQLQSERFITCLRKLDKKFPKLDMTKDIDIAESYIEN
ncbi:hypothetical protein [Listeria welshimeri]|uniref:hypothetical protein n=1 Tax=Listeria welshimeri TaxID=1643 RepID=UPI001628749F|nr:hypothetical protein [Listeria welshimeri]MBC1242593.1 hypothetical protein [Listeria welshimeri]MBC1588894.1 hypothetical protein [Listeria welshimeri]MBC2199915.1 hypothetical protein [Listeria welshimeri]MBC2275846.1 hypothetical protein [Listeria welshimeri]MBC2359887.1 hypothetical protein [Listeria welshimeri]